MRTRLFALAVILCCSPLAASADAPAKPNVIFILADDLGWADVGFHGSDIPTPHLDRLAKEGVQFNRLYVAPVCSPTRAGLLTGRYWSRYGIVVAESQQCLPDDTPTIASVVKGAGYRTGITGKWHLGGAALANKRPSKFGFEHSYGALDGAAHPFTHVYTGGGLGGDDGKGVKTWHRNGESIEEQGHVTDLIAAEALRFIARNQRSPFFLYVPFTAPHEKCLDTSAWMAKCAQIEPAERRPYAAMVAHMDAAIGQIVAQLERLKLRDKTLLVFCSDNGGDGQGRNAPFRAGKATVYEGGVRSVGLANWPGTLSPGMLQHPICIVDWLPTICTLAGATPPDRLDGQDVWPLLSRSTASVKPRPIYLLGMHGETSALVMGDWKLVRTKSGEELYDLANDPAEARNVAAENSSQALSLRRMMEDLAKQDRDSVAPEVATQR